MRNINANNEKTKYEMAFEGFLDGLSREAVIANLNAMIDRNVAPFGGEGWQKLAATNRQNVENCYWPTFDAVVNRADNQYRKYVDPVKAMFSLGKIRTYAVDAMRHKLPGEIESNVRTRVRDIYQLLEVMKRRRVEEFLTDELGTSWVKDDDNDDEESKDDGDSTPTLEIPANKKLRITIDIELVDK